MGHLEGNFTPVLYVGRKVPKGLSATELGCSPSEKQGTLKKPEIMFYRFTNHRSFLLRTAQGNNACPLSCYLKTTFEVRHKN